MATSRPLPDTKCAPEHEFSNLGRAFANYWRMKEEGTLPKLKHLRKDGEEGGFPHFKSKKRDQLSFYLNNDKFHVEGFWLHVPKLGKVNMAEQLRFQGKILKQRTLPQSRRQSKLVEKRREAGQSALPSGMPKTG